MMSVELLAILPILAPPNRLKSALSHREGTGRPLRASR